MPLPYPPMVLAQTRDSALGSTRLRHLLRHVVGAGTASERCEPCRADLGQHRAEAHSGVGDLDLGSIVPDGLDDRACDIVRWTEANGPRRRGAGVGPHPGLA